MCSKDSSNYLLFNFNSPTISTMTQPVETFTLNNGVLNIGSDNVFLRLNVDNTICKGDCSLTVCYDEVIYNKYTIFCENGDLVMYVRNRCC